MGKQRSIEMMGYILTFCDTLKSGFFLECTRNHTLLLPLKEKCQLQAAAEKTERQETAQDAKATSQQA